MKQEGIIKFLERIIIQKIRTRLGVNKKVKPMVVQYWSKL